MSSANRGPADTPERLFPYNIRVDPSYTVSRSDTGDAFSSPPEPAPPSASGRFRLPEFLRSVRHRNFRLFIGGQVISLIGTWTHSVAQSWLVYRLTGSSALLGLVAFAGQIPVLMFATLGGAVADRHRRQKIVLTTQTASMFLAFALATLTLSGLVHVWHIFVVAATLGIVNAFDIPARQAFVVEMVGKEDLSNAIALNSSVFNGARVIGPAFAGVAVAVVGEGWCFMANGVSFLAVIAGLLAMRLPAAERRPFSGSQLSHIAEGFGFAWKARPVRALLLLLGVVSLTGMPFTVLMPIFADRILHGGARALGILMGFSGVGAFAAALILAAHRTLHGVGARIGIACSCFGASLILFSISRHFWLSTALITAVGFFMVFMLASTNSVLQAMTPDRLRGRVMAVYSMMFLGIAPFGALFAGFLAQSTGAPVAVGAGGALCVVAALLFGWRLSSLRPDARKLIEAAETP
jgi:MFS family permease